MFSVLFCLVLFVGSAEANKRTVEMMKMSLEKSSSPPRDLSAHHIEEEYDEGLLTRTHHAQRVPRGSKSKQRDRHHPRPHPDPDGFFTTPRTFNGSLRVHNPLYPLTEESYSAYAVMVLCLLVFSVGVVGNLALMCIVWHNYYLKNTWNCVLASLALWDFSVLFFCMPVVIFNELTKRRLMGDLSCRVVPYVEVTSLGVTTFTLCALSIDHFHTVTSVQPRPRQVESCQSILAKLSVIWIGSMVLAAPELLTWQLEQKISPRTGLPVDSCIQQPSVNLPETLYSLVLTYHQARMWWSFGCFFCLPLFFTAACQLITRHVTKDKTAGKPLRPSSTSSSLSSSSSSPKKQQKQRLERQMTRTVVPLASIYAVCSLPENAWNIVLTYVGVEISKATWTLLALIGQFLLFVRAGTTPVLMLCVCRSLRQPFIDCCCCCCEECLPDPSSSSSSSSSTTNATAVSSLPSSPASVQEKLKIVSGTSPAMFFDKVKDSPDELIIGTPC
ncbi:G-protein coupled receptor 37-like 1 [Myxocyprinus asiaticus]|uniref:G-protein coupled receptor 37-like 1 n=1 Tax=Myxocyprinus asiaticus TaxID=70543 RepID=UPI002223B6AB|nr:G-protein coupled receptor 37-like 1 [Myxocyprinus asiaticus]